MTPSPSPRGIDLDPGERADAELFFERRMKAHQEPDGGYACDAHVILDHAIAAIEEAWT